MPAPVITLIVPGGSPACSTESIIFSTPAEATSEGLSTIVLPAARAGARLCTPSISGEFQGVITPTTPSGSRTT